MFSWSICVCLSACRQSGASQDVVQQTGVVDMVAQPKQVPLFKFQSTPMTFWTIKVKSKIFFSVPFQINWFYWSTGRRGTRNRRRCNWAGLYRRWLLSRSSRGSFDTIIFVLILLQKLWCAILWWYRFLIDWHMEGPLMTGGVSQDSWKVCADVV